MTSIKHKCALLLLCLYQYLMLMRKSKFRYFLGYYNTKIKLFIILGFLHLLYNTAQGELFSGQIVFVCYQDNRWQATLRSNCSSSNSLGNWGSWGQCSSHCDEGVVTRGRSCRAKYNDLCADDLQEHGACVAMKCQRERTPQFRKWFVIFICFRKKHCQGKRVVFQLHWWLYRGR